MRHVFLAAIFLAASLSSAPAATRATQFALSNGLEVVVVPDHRAPVVTQMLWYKVGGVDDPLGHSGLAHFFEHMMFKGTKSRSEDFSKIVARNGGQDNAFTTHDYTAYYERIAKDRLPLMMQLEADRMANLDLSEDKVKTELQVVMEERRLRYENDPSSAFQEQLSAALFLSHPYGRPVIGWMAEIEQITRQNALEYYKAHYAPNNAVLIIVGDVEPDAVKKMAENSFGKLPRRELSPRANPAEPPRISETRISHSSPDVKQPVLTRIYRVPSYVTAKAGQAEALDVLSNILGGGTTSRLYQTLVVDKKLVAGAGAWYDGADRDDGTFGIYAYPRDGVSFATLEAAIDEVIAGMKKAPPVADELTRTQTQMVASEIYERDSQSELANDYGTMLSIGLTIDDVEQWPSHIQKVDVASVQKAAQDFLLPKESVVGELSPEATAPEAAPAEVKSSEVGP
jgi:zinc protease